MTEFIDGHCYCTECCANGHCPCDICNEPCDCTEEEEDL